MNHLVLLITVLLSSPSLSFPSESDDALDQRDGRALKGYGTQGGGKNSFSLSSLQSQTLESGSGDDESEDLHSGKYCTDLSVYGPILYKDLSTVCCESKSEKKCVNKEKTIQETVTEMRCELVGWADCTMDWVEEPGSTCETATDTYPEMKCETKTRTVQHQKMEPRCWNETFDNCVTRLDDNGDAIETEDDCEKVVWKKCELVPVTKDFEEMYTDCYAEGEIVYDTYANGTKPTTVDIQTCEVKHAIDCKPIEITKTIVVEWTECNEEPQIDCQSRNTKMPYQEYIGRKKCLINGQHIEPEDEEEARYGKSINCDILKGPIDFDHCF